MPKRTAQRIIDSRTANRAVSISGVTLTTPSTSIDASTAGDGLTYTSGVLAVGAGTLISVAADTVGISTGSTYQFIGTGAGTSAAWQNLSTLAGAGLTHTTGVLAVGAGNGITVNADDVALTTPGGLSVSSTNSASGNHTHAITSSSNPGAAASILASDASGYLRLVRLGIAMTPTKPLDVTGNAGISGNASAGSLTVTGAATVGQDFTVGANVLYVNQAGTRVGINREPDQQFDLDVAGAIRGQYLVGKHAIQLASAVGVWHFDGSAPYNLDFNGSDASHVGIGGTATGGVIYRPGKFGKSLQMAGGITNLLSNPSFETNTTGWSAWASATLDRINSYSHYGEYALRITHVSSTTSGATISYTTSTQGTYTASAHVRSFAAADVGANISILMRFTYTDASTSDASANHTLTDTWTRIEATATTNGAKTLSSISVMLRDLLSGSAHYTMVDAVQLENNSFASPYCDGSLGSGHSWSGTAHASTSTRTAAQLTYTTAGVSEKAGTVMAWIYPFRSDGTQTIFRAQGSTAGNIYLLISSGTLAGYWGTAEVSSSAVSAKTWTHVAMTYSGTTLRLYINGVQAGSGTSSGFSGMPATFHVGGLSGANLLNGLIDDLVLLDYAADAKLIRAIYESDAPVFVESSVFHWRSPSRVPIWVDEFGLWARGVSGDEILGLYGGDPRNPTGAVTKSWGGITMSENDIVIGRSAGGYIFWDDSAQVMTVQGTITATAGSIGGWTVDSTKLVKDTGTAATSAGLAPSDYPVYAGATYANRATAPFRVTPAGALTATNATITGSITASSGSITGQLSIGTNGEIWQGTSTIPSPYNAGLRIFQSSSLGQLATYDGGAKTLRISNDDIRYVMATAFDSIRTIKWLDSIDYSGSWSDLSSANGNYAYIGAYTTSTNGYLYLSNRVNNTGSPANTRNSHIALVPSRNESSTLYTPSLYLTVYNSTGGYDGVALYTGMYLELGALSATPTRAADSAQVYVKGTNLIIRYNDSGTTRYKYLPLNGTGVTWTHTTTAP